MDARPPRSAAFIRSEDEFRKLFDRYFQPIFYFFLRRGIPSEDCRDLTQETFLRVYKGLGQFRGEANVQTWLFQISKNLWLNRVRGQRAGKREGKEISLDDAMAKGVPVLFDPSQAPGSEASDPLAEALVGEQLRVLRQALQRLPPQMRRCVLLRIDQNLKYREIAELMQISIDTVKSQLSQARARLAGELGRYFDVPELGED